MGPTLRRVFLEPLERKDGERGEKALALGPALQAAAQLTERLAARVARCINLIPGRRKMVSSTAAQLAAQLAVQGRRAECEGKGERRCLVSSASHAVIWSYFGRMKNGN